MHDEASHRRDIEIGLAVADLAALGIEFAPACGTLDVHGEWVMIGSLVANEPGRLLVVPRIGLIQPQSDRLLAVASKVWLHGTQVLTAWFHVVGFGRVADVGMRYSRESSFAWASSSAIWESETGNPFV